MITPLFSTSASLKQGGIFTVDSIKDCKARLKAGRVRGPVSLCKLAEEEKLTQVTLVESNFTNFMQAAKSFGEMNVQFRFGLKIVVCDNMEDKTEESLKNESKVVIFLQDDKAYKSLIALFTKAATEGFHQVPRLDWRTLKAGWNDGLLLALPFYSSFLAQNTLTFASIVPDLPAQPIALREIGQDMPFDQLLNPIVDKYAASGVAVEEVKSVYYRTRADAKKFLIYRCILKRGSTWDKPQQDHFTSGNFSFESWKALQ